MENKNNEVKKRTKKTYFDESWLKDLQYKQWLVKGKMMHVLLAVECPEKEKTRYKKLGEMGVGGNQEACIYDLAY